MQTIRIRGARTHNLANIDLTIRVQKHEELERRMTEIERRLRPPDLREIDLEPIPEFEAGRRESRPVEGWYLDT